MKTLGELLQWLFLIGVVLIVLGTGLYVVASAYVVFMGAA